MITWKLIEGKNKGSIRLYALSTCGWCKKTKRLLNNMGVEYKYIDVDELEDKERFKLEKEEVSKWNPYRSYPTLVFNNEKCIVGFDEEKILKEIE